MSLLSPRNQWVNHHDVHVSVFPHPLMTQEVPTASLSLGMQIGRTSEVQSKGDDSLSRAMSFSLVQAL